MTLIMINLTKASQIKCTACFSHLNNVFLVRLFSMFHEEVGTITNLFNHFKNLGFYKIFLA